MPRPSRKRSAPSASQSADISKWVHGGNASNNKVSDDASKPESSNFSVPFAGKSIVCQRRGPGESDATLIFTHGAGGGLDNPATELFPEGFASAGSSVISFQGTMNLKSRTQSFIAIMEHQDELGHTTTALGGRSMGARAAVIAAQERSNTKSLILVSYPLTSPRGEVRDKILLDLDDDKDVLFISGDKDSMCDLQDLQKVRDRMRAKTWLVVVAGADHGMSVTSKAAIEPLRLRSGVIGAEWLADHTSGPSDSVIGWDKSKKEIYQRDRTGGGDHAAGGQKTLDGQGGSRKRKKQ